MLLTFSAYPNPMSLYLEARQSSWPETEFSQTKDGKGIMFSVHNLGTYGTGTVRLDFLMTQYSQYTLESNLHLTVDLSMHQETFLQLTSLKTYASVYVPILS